MTVEPAYTDPPESGSLEFDEFEHRNWKSGQARDLHADLMRRASEAKREAEWRSVMDSETDRKAAIIHVNNTNREEWLKRVGKHGLAYRDIRYTSPYSGYSHQFHPTDKSDPNRITYAVIAENEDVADAMEEAELDIDDRHERHHKVGELLGFPDCCQEKFVERFVDDEMIDPMYETACNTPEAEPIDGDPEAIRITDANPGACPLWRYFGWTFITHLPCSFTCPHSVDIARDRYRVMCEAGYEEAADALHRWLDQPFEWTGYHGIMEMRNAYFIGSARTSDYWSEKRIVWQDDHDELGH